jgi:hypothetical protein
MSTFVIRQIHPEGLSALATQATTFNLASAAIRNEVVIGKYLEWSDPDARGGRGDDRWTDDVAKAKRFATHAAAFECWRARSRTIPTRPDGKPNRPMTAYSVSIEELKD